MYGIPKDLLDVSCELSRDKRTIEVEWDSTRSDKHQEVVARVNRITARRDGYFEMKITRVKDNQDMWIDNQMKIYSVNSEYPLTGTVTDIREEDWGILLST